MSTKLCPRCKERLCGTTSSGKQLDYCEPCQSDRTVEKQQAFKSACVNHKGGACSSCGYSRYQGALCLPVCQHLRKHKTYIKMGSLAGTLPLSQRVRDELAQRELLCMNCYRATQCKTDNPTKIKLVNMKGGACSSCGYSSRACALDFHHVDGRGAPTKSLTIGSRTKKSDLISLTAEVEKCILLCSNCHLEHHHKGDCKMTEVDTNLQARASAELKEEVSAELEKDDEVVLPAEELINNCKGGGCNCK